MEPLRKFGAAGIILAIIAAQVIVPAALDMMLSLALVGTAAWAGWKAAKYAP